MKKLLFLCLLCLPFVGWTQELRDTAELKVGDRCPSFVFKDTANVEQTLQQFKGKYVVIDVWESWCYPCKKEYPVLRKLAGKYEGKNIVFISLSCDRREQDWRNGLWWEKMTGYQWWIAGDESSMLAFRVAAIPRFILLDKKGRVLNLKLPKPSNPEFERILINLKGL